MNQTAHTTATQAALNHLDQLYSDDCEALLPTAAEAIENAAMALRDSKPVHPDVIARLLDSAARTVRLAHKSIEAAAMELEESRH
jgi:hypothetical protein